MVAPSGPPGFGDPASVQKLGAAAGQAGLDLEKLKSMVNKDVRAAIPDVWGGDAASAFQKWMNTHLKFLTTPDSPEAAYDNALEAAAQTMAKAREQLRTALRYINNNDLYIGDGGLTVHAYITQRPDADAVVSAGQSQLNAAVQIAQLAQQQIKAANTVYEAAVRKFADDLMAISSAIPGGGKAGIAGKGKGTAGKAQKRYKYVTEADMIRAIRASPTIPIGKVSPPSTVPAGQNLGNVMADRVDSVVRQRYPDLQFGRAPNGVEGPDMPVIGRTPGTPDPGFDWGEIKHDTDAAVEKLVREEWGKSSVWSGRGRLFVWDDLGNVKEVVFPFDTGK